MKKLIIVNGTMGVGKTTTCKILNKKLNKSVFLDGDLCWDMNPFIVTRETKEMAISNITHLLHNFLTCSECDYVIFNWVLDKESVYQAILEALSDLNFELYRITLVCNEETLESRWYKDKINEWRIPEWPQVSKKSLELFDSLEAIKIDTNNISAEDAANQICDYIMNSHRILSKH
jgi:broad-specificity NMP kinase